MIGGKDQRCSAKDGVDAGGEDFNFAGTGDVSYCELYARAFAFADPDAKPNAATVSSCACISAISIR
jgi:hypothetical protein